MKISLIDRVQRLRRGGVYALALLAGLVSAWAVREHVQQRVSAIEDAARTPLVSRLVAAYDLPAGTQLDASHVAVREIPAQWAASGSLDPLDADSLLGATLVADVAHGEPVLKAYLTFQAPAPALASRLQSGQRALTVTAADLGGLAEQVQSGDLLDIYVSFSHQQRALTVPLLQGMRVLTVGGSVDGDGFGASGNITLAASPDEAMRFVAARQAGTLTAMLRHREDVSAVNASAQSDLASLVGLDEGPKPAPGVTILYGDRLDGQSMGAPAGAASAVPSRFESEHP